MARAMLAQNLEASMCMSDAELERALAVSILTKDSSNIILVAHAIVARAAQQPTDPANEPTTPRSFPA